MSFTSISWFVKMFLGDNVSKNQRQSSILSDSRFLFFDIYNVAYIKVKPNSKKKNHPLVQEIWLAKVFPKFQTWKKLEFHFNLMVPSRSHSFMFFVF